MNIKKVLLESNKMLYMQLILKRKRKKVSIILSKKYKIKNNLKIIDYIS